MPGEVSLGPPTGALEGAKAFLHETFFLQRALGPTCSRRGTHVTGRFYLSEDSEGVGSGQRPCPFWSLRLSLERLTAALPVPCPGPCPAPQGTVLTHTAGLVPRPLVVLLARDDPLPHQLEGCLALKSEGVPMQEAAASPLPVGGDPRVPASSLFDF